MGPALVVTPSGDFLVVTPSGDFLTLVGSPFGDIRFWWHHLVVIFTCATKKLRAHLLPPKGYSILMLAA